MPCDLRCAVNARLSETGGVPVVRFTAVKIADVIGQCQFYAEWAAHAAAADAHWHARAQVALSGPASCL
jgi:hypothetical protein